MLFLLYRSFSNVRVGQLLEEAQDAIKKKRSVDSDLWDQIQDFMAVLLTAPEKIMLRMEAELEGSTAYLGQPTAERMKPRLSKPRKSIFRLGRNAFDIDLERWYLLLAYWDTCLTLLLVPCQGTPFSDITSHQDGGVDLGWAFTARTRHGDGTESP